MSVCFEAFEYRMNSGNVSREAGWEVDVSVFP